MWVISIRCKCDITKSFQNVEKKVVKLQIKWASNTRRYKTVQRLPNSKKKFPYISFKSLAAAAATPSAEIH